MMLLPKKTNNVYQKKKIRMFHHIKDKINSFLPERVSTPVFVFGSQRSGTTMLMNVFELNNNFFVYHEGNKNVFDDNFRIVNFNIVSEAIQKSNFQYVVFKPISDSHLIDDFSEKFSNSKILWLYRNFKDVSNSAAVKWNTSERNSIREIGQGIANDDWFTEGLSESTINKIRLVYKEKFSLHECAAIWWWARNRIAIEKKIYLNNNVLMVNYDYLVKNPQKELSCISRFLGTKRPVSSKSYIHARSIHKQVFPVIDERVKELCEQLSDELEGRMVESRKNLQKV